MDRAELPKSAQRIGETAGQLTPRTRATHIAGFVGATLQSPGWPRMLNQAGRNRPGGEAHGPAKRCQADIEVRRPIQFSGRPGCVTYLVICTDESYSESAVGRPGPTMPPHHATLRCRTPLCGYPPPIQPVGGRHRAGDRRPVFPGAIDVLTNLRIVRSGSLRPSVAKGRTLHHMRGRSQIRVEVPEVTANQKYTAAASGWSRRRLART